MQLATEIEAIKKQERALLTKVESQQYLEREMRSELEQLRSKLFDIIELARSEVTKLQTSQEAYLEELVVSGVDVPETTKALKYLEENLELYKSIIRDPESFVERVVEEMQEDGEYPEGEDRMYQVVRRALASRNLSQEEKELQEEREAREEQVEEVVESEKNWSRLQMLMATIVALVILIVTFKVVKGENNQ